MLVRADTGACSKAFLHHITDAGLEYSSASLLVETVKAAIEAIPPQAWRAAIDSDGLPRAGAQVAELTAWMPVPPSRPGPRPGSDRSTGLPGCGSSPAASDRTPARSCG